MGEQVERIIISLEADDKASLAVQRARQRVDRLTKSVKNARSATVQFNKALDQENRQFERTFRLAKQLEKDRDQRISQLKQIKQAIKEVNDARRRGIAEARAVGQVGRGAQQIGGSLGGIAGPEIGQIANIGPDILRTAESLGVLKQQLPALTTNFVASAGGATAATAALGLMAAVLLAAVVVYKVFTDIVEKSKEATESLIDVNERYAEILATSTTKEVEATIKANEDRNKALEIERERLRAFIDATEEIDGVAGAILDFNDALNANLGGYEDVQDKLDEVNDELKNNVDLNTQLGAAIARGATAARDAIVAEEELAKIRRSESAQIISDIRAGIDAEAKARQQAETFTSKQLEDRKAQIKAGLELEAQFRQSTLERKQAGDIDNQLARDALSGSIEKQIALERELELLETFVKESVQAREREVATLKLVETNVKLTRAAYENAIKSQAKFTNELAEFAAERLQIEEEFAEKTIEINDKRHLGIIQEDEKAALDRVNDLADHYQDLAELDRDFFEDRADLLENIGDDLNDLDDEKLIALKEFNKTEIRSTVDHLKRLNEIRLRAQNSIRSASARLDALGIFEAKQAAEEELKNENEKFQTEKKRRGEDFRDLQQQLVKERQEILRAGQQALRDLQIRHQRERQSAIAAFNEKIRREDQQFALERSQQQQRWALEDRQRQEQFDNEATAQAEHFSLLLTLTTNGLFQTELAYQAWLDSMSARTVSTLPTPVGAPAANLPTGNLPAFSSPNALTNGPQGAVDFRQPATAPSLAGEGMAGASIIINIDGSRQPMQVGAEVRRELENVFGGIADG